MKKIIFIIYILANIVAGKAQEFNGFGDIKINNSIDDIVKNNPLIKQYTLVSSEVKYKNKKNKSLVSSIIDYDYDNSLLLVDSSANIFPVSTDNYYIEQFRAMPGISIYYLSSYQLQDISLNYIFLFVKDSKIIFIDCCTPSFELIDAIKEKYAPTFSDKHIDTVNCIYKLTGVSTIETTTFVNYKWDGKNTSSEFLLSSSFDDNCKLSDTKFFLRVYDAEFKADAMEFIIQLNDKKDKQIKSKTNSLKDKL